MSEFTSVYPEKFIAIYHYEQPLYPSTQTIAAHSYEEFRNCAMACRSEKNFKWAVCIDRKTGAMVGGIITSEPEPPVDTTPTIHWPD